MGPGFAQPGGGKFPEHDFWLRAISLTVSGQGWALIGHSGDNGDVVSPMVYAGQSGTIRCRCLPKTAESISMRIRIAGQDTIHLLM
jgi:hypothetical protein